MNPHFDTPEVTLWHGDCIEVMHTLPDASIDAVVTDPPYGLEFMGRDWDGADGFRRSLNANDTGRESVFGRSSRTSPEYRAGHAFGAWCELWATEVLRLLKPGGHLLAFGGTRTFHRLTCAIEDAGFEIRDSIAWLYGSGFPKSRNLDGDWAGWGTALKPAFEPIVVARKPFAGTVASNVLTHGTGALNIDATRIAPTDPAAYAAKGASVVGLGSNRTGAAYGEWTGARTDSTSQLGRWPANVILEESQAAALDEQSGNLPTQKTRTNPEREGDGGLFGLTAGGRRINPGAGETGGASRFFYTAKAGTAERPNVDGLAHPTVKPLDLMQWLVRLVTPRGGTVLEPFAGSGTTAEACVREGFRCVAIEREATYLPLIMQRLDKPHAVGFDIDWEAS